MSPSGQDLGAYSCTHTHTHTHTYKPYASFSYESQSTASQSHSFRATKMWNNSTIFQNFPAKGIFMWRALFKLGYWYTVLGHAPELRNGATGIDKLPGTFRKRAFCLTKFGKEGSAKIRNQKRKWKMRWKLVYIGICKGATGAGWHSCCWIFEWVCKISFIAAQLSLKHRNCSYFYLADLAKNQKILHCNVLDPPTEACGIGPLTHMIPSGKGEESRSGPFLWSGNQDLSDQESGGEASDQSPGSYSWVCFQSTHMQRHLEKIYCVLKEWVQWPMAH